MKIVQSLLVLVLLSVPGRLKASNPKVDSLLHLLETHTAADRAEVLWAVAYELFDVDNPEAAFYAERAYHEVWAKGDSLQIVKIGTTHTQLQRRLGNLDQSIQMAIPLLQIARRHNYRKYEKMLLNGLSICYMYREDYGRALEIGYESLSMRIHDADSTEIGVAYGNIGYIHYKMNDYKTSLEYLEKGVAFARRDTSTMIIHMGTIAANYCDLKQYRTAIQYYKRTIEMELKRQNRPSLGQDFSGLASAYFHLGMLDSASHFASLAIQRATIMKNVWPLTLGHLLLSKIAMLQGKLEDANGFLEIAKDACKNYQYPYLRLEVTKQEALLLAAATGNFRSISLFEKYLIGQDSLFHGESEQRLRAVQILQAQKENELKIKAQQDILNLQDQLLARQKVFMVIVLGLLITVAILAAELFRAYKRKVRVNHLLDVKVAERTVELGHQRDRLQHFIDEEKILKRRVIREVLSQTNTLRGLIHLGKIDQGSNVEEYLSNADTVTCRIQNTVSKLGG